MRGGHTHTHTECIISFAIPFCVSCMCCCRSLQSDADNGKSMFDFTFASHGANMETKLRVQLEYLGASYFINDARATRWGTWHPHSPFEWLLKSNDTNSVNYIRYQGINVLSSSAKYSDWVICWMSFNQTQLIICPIRPNVSAPRPLIFAPSLAMQMILERMKVDSSSIFTH